MANFCEQCKYYLIDNDVFGVEACQSPKNIFWSYRGMEKFWHKPHFINKNNDCTFFERKKTILEKLNIFFKRVTACLHLVCKGHIE